MDKSGKIHINKIVGLVLLILYGVSAVGVVTYCVRLDMIPTKYIVIIAVVLILLFALLLIMHKKLVTSVISSVLSVILIAICVLGSVYIRQTTRTIADVTTVETQKNIVCVYVMKDDPAESVEDIVNYNIGIVSERDRENTDKAIATLEQETGSSLTTSEYANMYTMMTDLKAQTIQAVIINDAYVSIIADSEQYSWVGTDLRKIAEVENPVEETAESATQVPENLPETFVMYLSGIDTYGDISTCSRSDVNILAVVNTKTKDVLLLSTPRDSYLAYSVTGGAKDKLTHAGIYGVDASMDALEQLYGIDIPYYLRINFTGFVDIIDALGGVDVYSEQAFTSRHGNYTFQQGYNHMDGDQALGFARERYSFTDGDYQRARNQMEVIKAVIKKCASSSILTNYSSVMNSVAGTFETNMPEDQIAALVKMQLSDMAEWNVTSYTTSGTGTSAETYSMPGQELYVINLDELSIEEAKRQIQEVIQE